MDLQRRFLDHFLKGADNGWDQQPRVLLNIRHPGEQFVLRAENEWPLARTRWTTLDLDCATLALSESPSPDASREYDASGEGLTFRLPPVERETEITGPMAAKLFISSSTSDADLFLVVRSRPYQPYHPHDAVEPLTPGAVYDLGVEIIPSCIVLPPGIGWHSASGDGTTSTGGPSPSSAASPSMPAGASGPSPTTIPRCAPPMCSGDG